MLYRLWNTNEDNSAEAAEMSSAGRLKEIINVLRQRELLQGITPVKVRQVLEDLGPTFVKLGQIISMRPDFLPTEYRNELTKLQSDVRPMEFSVVKEIINREYQQNWNQIFSYIDSEAMGSAS